MFAAQIEKDTTRDQHFQRRSGCKQLRHYRRGREQLLEIIQQKQHVFVTEVILQVLKQRLAARGPNLQLLRDVGDHPIQSCDITQLYKEDPIFEMLNQPAGNFQTKSSFACATGTCKRHYLYIFAKKSFTRPCKLLVPSNQGCWLVRKIVKKISRRWQHGMTARSAAQWICIIKLLDLTRT